MEPNPDPTATEIADLKHQIDQMDRQIGLHRGTIIMQQRIVDALIQTKKLFNAITENLCQCVLNDQPAAAKILAGNILNSLKNGEQRPHASPKPKPTEPELTFPEEPEPAPSATGSPTTSTSTSSDPVPPASEPTI